MCMACYLHDWDSKMLAVSLISALFLFLSLSPWTSNLTPNSFGLSSSSSSFSGPACIATKSRSSLHLFFMLVSSEHSTPFSFFSRLFSSTRLLYPDEDEVDDDLWSSSSSCTPFWSAGPPTACCCCCCCCCCLVHAFRLRISQSSSLSPLRNMSLQNSQRLVATLRNPCAYIHEYCRFLRKNDEVSIKN